MLYFIELVPQYMEAGRCGLWGRLYCIVYCIVYCVLYCILYCILYLSHTTVHGGWAMWSVWGDCTMTCGGGQRRRFRTCSNPAPKHNGRPCIGAGQDTERCNEIKCAGRFIYKEIVHMHMHT